MKESAAHIVTHDEEGLLIFNVISFLVFWRELEFVAQLYHHVNVMDVPCMLFMGDLCLDQQMFCYFYCSWKHFKCNHRAFFLLIQLPCCVCWDGLCCAIDCWFDFPHFPIEWLLPRSKLSPSLFVRFHRANLPFYSLHQWKYFFVSLFSCDFPFKWISLCLQLT